MCTWKVAHSNVALSIFATLAGRYRCLCPLTSLRTHTHTRTHIDTHKSVGIWRFRARPQKGQTLLHWAASGGHLELARALLAAGAPKDAVNGQGHTPLWAAGVHGRVALVAELAGAGCDREAKEGKVRAGCMGGVRGVRWGT